MAGSRQNLHTVDSRSACIQGVLKVKVKGHVIRALFWILGMSFSVIDGLVLKIQKTRFFNVFLSGVSNKKLSYCWETVRRESMPRIAEMDVEMTT